MKPRFQLILAFATLALAPCLPAANSNPAAVATTFEVPRLKAHPKPGDLPGIAKTKVTVDDLLPHTGDVATSGKKDNLPYLALTAGQDFGRSLRGASTGTTFVAFSAYVSDGTTIDVGAAKLAVGPSDRTGYLRLKLGIPSASETQWRPLDEMKIEQFGGVALAALPTLTVRLDPAAGIWDLFVFNRLAAEDLPLPALSPGAAKRFTVHAGANGVWLLGLIDSDENPLYVDTNANGIDDTFEKAQNGGVLLAANATAAARTRIAQAWKIQQRTATSAKPWVIKRPQPDK